MMRGETVSVIPREQSGADAMLSPTWAELDPVDVPNVLVKPGDTDDVADEVRDGDAVAYTLYWPKAYDGPSLDGLELVVRGERVRVIGAPRPYDPGACPTDWNMVVRAGAVDG